MANEFYSSFRVSFLLFGSLALYLVEIRVDVIYITIKSCCRTQLHLKIQNDLH
jgi:hypothetical protein